MAPAQKPGRSRQDYGTPMPFLDAVEQRFGTIAWDLAATDENRVSVDYFGPGSREGENALVEPWHTIAPAANGLLWLNPPFADLAPWAAKCAAEQAKGARIVMLAPAAVGSVWYAQHVEPNAYVFAVRPRLTFVGETAPYPKDLIACYFAPERLRGFESWRWAPERPRGKAAR
jgi:phage N-6-adenine-methyltransferase